MYHRDKTCKRPMSLSYLQRKGKKANGKSVWFLPHGQVTPVEMRWDAYSSCVLSVVRFAEKQRSRRAAKHNAVIQREASRRGNYFVSAAS